MGIDKLMKEAMAQVKREVHAEFVRLGEQGVQYAKEKGSYHDITGNLRRSNTYHADENTLTLTNTADYASDVEARGKDVLGGAILNLKKELGK